MNIMDLAAAIAPDCKHHVVGIRPGEKLHEVMVPEDDARNAIDLGDRFVILPQFEYAWIAKYKDAKRCPEGFRYASDTNDRWLTRDQLVEMLKTVTIEGTPAA
jgi:UDP-N-acetylglucosamine 4,6-dehydratase